MPCASAAAAGDALPVVPADVVLVAHAHFEQIAQSRVVEHGFGETEVGRKQTGHVGDQFSARLRRGGAEEDRVVVRQRHGRFNDRPQVAVERCYGRPDVVDRRQGYVDDVQFLVVEHVVHAAVGVYVGHLLFYDVPAFLQQVADRRDCVQAG